MSYINSMRGQIILLLLSVSSLGLGQDHFPDLPKNDWVRETLARFKAHGFGHHGLTHPHGLPTRSDFALTAASVVDDLISQVEVCEREFRAPAFTPLAQSKGRSLERSLATDLDYVPVIRRDLPQLRRLVNYFSPELRQAGRDPVQMDRALFRIDARLSRLRVARTGEALERFPDVPPTHWASRALGDLRKNGLIQGYPSGRFGGP